jgi:hypothetical protein
LRLGLAIKVVGLDAELNSLPNGDIFKCGYRTKSGGFAQNTEFLYPILPILLVYSADIHFEAWAHSKSSWARCRIKFSI